MLCSAEHQHLEITFLSLEGKNVRQGGLRYRGSNSKVEIKLKIIKKVITSQDLKNESLY